MDKIANTLRRTLPAAIPPLSRRQSLPAKPSVRQDVFTRNFVSSPARRAFGKDSLFGTDYRPAPRKDQSVTLHYGESEMPPIDGHVSTEEAQVRHRLSADYRLKPDYLDKKEARQVQEEFDKAFTSQGGKLPMEYPTMQVTTALGFSTKRNLLTSGKAGAYVNFSREIIQKTLERDGTHHFNTGYMCMHRHFRDMVATEADHGKPFADFAATATLKRDLRPVQVEPGSGVPPVKKAAPTITGIELADSMEGRPKEWYAQERQKRGPDGAPPFKVLSSMAEPVDLDRFTELYTAARDLSLSDVNKACFNDSKRTQFSPQAKKAVEALQEFLSGDPRPLPSEDDLLSDPTLGTDRSRWKNDVI